MHEKMLGTAIVVMLVVVVMVGVLMFGWWLTS